MSEQEITHKIHVAFYQRK